jgi:hypothetical protein
MSPSLLFPDNPMIRVCSLNPVPDKLFDFPVRIRYRVKMLPSCLVGYMDRFAEIFTRYSPCPPKGIQRELKVSLLQQIRHVSLLIPPVYYQPVTQMSIISSAEVYQIIPAGSMHLYHKQQPEAGDNRLNFK